MFADAVLVAGAVTQGRPAAGVPVGFVPSSRVREPGWGIRPGEGDPASVDAHCVVAERAQTGVEVVNQAISRLERVRLVAVAEGVVAMGRAELAGAGLDDPAALSATGRERWRARCKSRVRQDLAAATGWSKSETTTVVAVATAPGPFRSPVSSALARGTVSWALVRHLWRSCDRAGLSAADAAHVAQVMLADDPATCVPERLAPDGTVARGPWGQGAFWVAVEREVVRLVACPDPGDEASARAAEEARAAREAAYRGRSMQIRVNEDGTAQVFFTGTALKVLALGDRLERAARAARGGGDARTVVQLANDIGLALLGHAVIGAHELPDLNICKGAAPTPEDLAAAGWTPQVITALSALPPAVLQVVVPLLALHDPGAAHTLPGLVGSSTGDDGAGRPAGQPAHTGAPGCPACLPSVRAARSRAIDHGRSHDRDQRCGPDRDDGSGEGAAPDRDEGSGEDCAPEGRLRVAWVGRVLGRHPGFVAPGLVRALAHSPGSTLVRLLVDPADGRCLERSTGAYGFDAAMRAQLAAADVTCRAPGCEHPAGGCQVDHVVEHATGGATKESNAQLLDVWHHDPKTAKAWDAVLHANRDVTWTTTLSRVYRTRVHDYRELVTVITDALERVAAVPQEDVADQINREVYQALCYRGAGRRLNEGDDDVDEAAQLARFGGPITVGLSHRDPVTGRRSPGPSPAARTRADTAAVLARTAPPQGQVRDSTPGRDRTRGSTDRAPGCGQTSRARWDLRRDDPPPF